MTSSGKTPLHNAAKEGHEMIVRWLVEAGADVNEATDDRATGQIYDGVTPLCIAALEGREEVVRGLLQAGADLNKADGRRG